MTAGLQTSNCITVNVCATRELPHSPGERRAGHSQLCACHFVVHMAYRENRYVQRAADLGGEVHKRRGQPKREHKRIVKAW
jgi:hypothetical protein